MTPTDQFAPDEAQNDPTASGSETPGEATVVEGEDLPRALLEAEDIEAARRQGTGPHRRIRSTGTDKKPIQPIAEGVENDTQRLKKKEPEDNRPDQLDRNK